MNRNFFNKNKALRSKLARKLLVHYIYALILYGLFLAAALFLSVLLATSLKVWYAKDPLYRFLKQVEHFFLPVGGAAGWAIITYYFISKPLRYLDELVNAAEKLAQPSESPILLSENLKAIQDELNDVRLQSLKNEALAREAKQRKDDLIVYLAHDLKTPLTSVIGYLSLLSESPSLSEPLREKYTAIALGKAQRLEDLINEFFDITRFSLTTLSLETERINLSRMIEQIASEFYPVLKEKGLEWSLSVAPDVYIVCDPDKLARVFDNLIRNAVNYGYPNSVINLSLSSAEDGITLLIQNHGRTIPPEKLSRIFEQFFRLDSSRASATGGAGLGLAIAKEIVELHGGSIKAESADESISFTVFLPKAKTVSQ